MPAEFRGAGQASGGEAGDTVGRRARRQRSEHIRTASQSRAHALRQAKGRPQTVQILVGRSPLRRIVILLAARAPQSIPTSGWIGSVNARDPIEDALRTLVFCCLALLLVYIAPVALRAALTYRTASGAWWGADRSSAGLLPSAGPTTPAMVRIFAARTVSWRGILAVHSWAVVKPEGGAYERYDLTAWGDPIRVNGFAPDALWFGQRPMEVYALDGAAAAAAIPPIRAAIADYRYAHRGDYAAWPGPNSNTFVATVMAAIPDVAASLPPTAIGKDFPVDGRWIAPTPSRTGLRLTLGGYAGLTVGWVEGVQLNLFGLVAGFDIRRPAILLPAFGRVGV